MLGRIGFLIFILILVYCNAMGKPWKDCHYKYYENGRLFVLNGTVYYFGAHSVNISTARTKCQDFGMSLMDMSTPEREGQFNEIRFNILKYPAGTAFPPDLWTSGELDMERNVWVWTNLGEDFSDYANERLDWFQSGPYPYLFKFSHDRWLTARDSEVYPFLCKTP